MNHKMNYKWLLDNVITDRLTFVDGDGTVVDEAKLDLDNDGCIEVMSIEYEDGDIQVVVDFKRSVTNHESKFSDELEDEW